MKPAVSHQYDFVPVATLTWVIMLATAILATIWVLYDARNLWQLRGKNFADPLNRDKRFGFVMGVIIGLVGIVGVAIHVSQHGMP